MDHQGLQPVQSQLVAQVAGLPRDCLSHRHPVHCRPDSHLLHPRNSLAYRPQHVVDLMDLHHHGDPCSNRLSHTHDQ